MTSSSFFSDFSELKRRRVFRTAAVYVVVGWATVQVSDVMFPRLALPDWSVTLVVALVIVGFPIALALAWAFDVTPEGVVRASAEGAGPVSQDFAGAAERQPSIAVLPFADMSPGKDNEYFSDGVAEEIINALTQVPGLKVIARTSAFAFKGQHTDVRRIAQVLGVTHVLEGSVRKAGDRIRVTVQLITAADGSHLWSRPYDGDLTDVFAIQNEIAQSIAGELQVTLSGDAHTRPRYTPKLPAYETFLRGRHHLGRWTPESLAKARECMEEAIRLDPQFASAYSELGWCFFALATVNQMPPREAADLTNRAARTALEIDPALSDPQMVLGIAAVLDHDWNEAGRRFQLAMTRQPVSPFARYMYSIWYLAPVGRMEDAEEQLERALLEDPLNLQFKLTSGMLSLGRGRNAEGEAKLRQLIDFDENYWIPYAWLAALRATQGLHAEALPFAEKAYLLVPSQWLVIGLLAGILESTGDRTRAATLTKKLGDGAAFGAPAGFVSYHLALGDVEAAADWFEKVIEQRDTRAPWIFPHLFDRALRTSSRWPSLAKLMNLP